MRRIGIITGGGDCAGLNTVIASIVKAGVYHGDYELVGFHKGWNGILDKDYIRLDLEAVRNISNTGGTILGTTNHGRFNAKGSGDGQQVPQDVLEEARDNLRELGIEGLIVIGGDGTLSGAAQLMELGINVVGVPKTIDNDLSGTDQTFGFSTAVDVAVESLDRIHTTASSHERVFFVECMGRHAGWVALYAGMAANVNAILVPEFALDIPSLVSFVRGKLIERGSAVVIVAEGIAAQRETFTQNEYTDREIQLHGAASTVIDAIEAYTPEEFEMRSVVLGHTLRGGSPNSYDRILAKRYGLEAFEAYNRGDFGTMVCLRANHIGTVPIKDAINQPKRVTHDNSLYNAVKRLGVYVNW